MKATIFIQGRKTSEEDIEFVLKKDFTSMIP